MSIRGRAPRAGPPVVSAGSALPLPPGGMPPSSVDLKLAPLRLVASADREQDRSPQGKEYTYI